MKAARIVVLAVAVVAGGAAAFLARGGPPKTIEKIVEAKPSLPTTEVLVAAADVPMGTVVKPEMMKWQPWPEDAAGSFISRSSNPSALENLSGAIARQPIVAGEPIREAKLIKADGSGFLSAILPAGMRAVAVEISAENGAGGFILPNDHVDVLLTSRFQLPNGGGDDFRTATILTNVRVLAIDQMIQDQDGQKVVVGRTATLGVAPDQSEVLARARQKGTISLALRSLADATSGLEGGPQTRSFDPNAAPTGNTMTIVRFGVATEVQSQ